jgi:hypothetical protein
VRCHGWPHRPPCAKGAASKEQRHGAAASDGEDVETGDAAKVTHGPILPIRARERRELILVDVPMQFEPVGIWRSRV